MNSVIIALFAAQLVLISPDMADVQKVYEVPGVKKSAIYQKALEWMATNYNSSSDVIQLKDDKNYKIIGRGTGTLLQIISDRKYDYTITIEIKDGKFRLTFSNISSRKYSNRYNVDFDFSNAREKITIKLDGLGENLASYIQSSNKKSDW